MFEIGSSLREARVRQGRTFADLESSTQIRSRYLRALEDEQFSVLPGPTYIRGFLRVYADDLGLDGQLYVDEFNSRYLSSEETRTVFRHSDGVTSARSRRIASAAVILSIITIAAVVFLIVVALGGKSPAKKPSEKQSMNWTVAAKGGAVVVVARARERGGTLLFSGKLLRGQSHSFSSSPVWLRVRPIQHLRLTLPGGYRPPFAGQGSKTMMVTRSSTGQPEVQPLA